MKYLNDTGVSYLITKIKTWLADKANKNHTHVTSEITDLVVPTKASDVGAIAEPTNEGTNGQVLTTDGAGGRTWTTIEAGASVITATGSFSATTKSQFISLGFEPDLVLCYTSWNNNKLVAASANTVTYDFVPRILTKAFLDEDSYIDGNGFYYKASSSYTTYYLAVKF